MTAPPDRAFAGREATGYRPVDASDPALSAVAAEIVTGAIDAMYTAEVSGKITAANPACSVLTGYPRAELLEMTWFDLTVPEQHDLLRAATAERVSGSPSRPLELTLQRKDGSRVEVEITAQIVTGNGPPHVLGVARDISQRVAHPHRTVPLAERSPDAICATDLNGVIVDVNLAAQSLSGYTREELIGRSLFELTDPTYHAHIADAMATRIAGGPAETMELPLLTKSRGRVYVEVIWDLVAGDGEEPRFVGAVRDVTQRRAREQQLRYLALHDPLTGLPNRTLFRDRLNQALARSERDSSDVAVLLLDLDDFKGVNDSLGHAAGDELLVAIAGRLERVLRAGETVTRLGGDEFAVVAEGLCGSGELDALVHRVAATLDGPFVLNQRGGVVVHGSLGVAVACGGEPDALLAAADAAMYSHKAGARNAPTRLLPVTERLFSPAVKT